MTQPMEVRGSGSTRSSAQPAGSVDFRQPASRLETPRPAPVVLRVARLGDAAAVCPGHHRPAHVFALYRLPWHPDSSGARYRRGRALFHAFLAAHLTIAAIGIVLMREECRQLLMVPVYRIIYEPLRAYLLYTAVYVAVRGVRAGWNKLARTGTLDTGLVTVHQPAQQAVATAGMTER
jgi:hypothetical protein